MATVTGFTAERMLEIENNTVVDGEVDNDGNLILTKQGGGQVNAGYVLGGQVPGVVSMYAGATPPPGALICDGSVYLQADYPDLFAVIGSQYNTGGEDPLSFRIPNLKGRVVSGLNSAETEFDNLGATGGSKTHTLSESEMPSHTHVQNAHAHPVAYPEIAKPNHTHGAGDLVARILLAAVSTGQIQMQRVTTAAYGVTHIVSGQGAATGPGTSQTTGAQVAGSTDPPPSSNTQAVLNSTATNQNTGGGAAHNNLQPYIVLNYIIFV